ncbi:MAG: hypothetical protein BWY21_02280 [Parcubacteria group bacterium ADurb.Bin216]|nr:MAG: hypothetical protein BWY21_02280 [Parcubacteria group bacterium ADurb.Bin216]
MPLTPEQISNALDCTCPSLINEDTFERWVLDLLLNISNNLSDLEVGP